MTPEAVHWIAQEIRNQRDALTAQEKWARSQAHSTAKIDLFERVNFWRDVLKYAERKIAVPGSRHTVGTDRVATG